MQGRQQSSPFHRPTGKRVPATLLDFIADKACRTLKASQETSHTPVMSVLSADIHAELAQLLQGLQSADNSVRSRAEEHLQNNWTAARPEILLMGLAEQVQGAGDDKVRALAASSLLCLPAPQFAASPQAAHMFP